MIDYSSLASLFGEELDDELQRQDYDCKMCGLHKGQHYNHCIVPVLLETRKKMVPMIIEV